MNDKDMTGTEKYIFSENGQLHISKLHRIVRYAPKEHAQYIYPGTLPTYELMYYIKGDTRLQFNGETFYMKEGDILYLPKGIGEAEYIVTVREPFDVYNIYFDSPDKLPDRPIQIHTRSEEFKRLYEKSYQEWFFKRDGYYYRIMQNIFHIFELAEKQQMQYNTKQKFRYLIPAEEYLSLHYCDVDFDYDKLHQLTGLSYSYFKKLFIDKYGMPPSKYITHLKISRACELLQTGMFHISQIAEQCGYENVYYFSNVFKKYMGVSPKQKNNTQERSNIMKVDIEKLDKNLVPSGNTEREDAVFRSIREEPFQLYGMYDPKNQRPFVRIPREVTDQVGWGYSLMNSMLAGARARFQTDSAYIILKVTTPSITPYTTGGTITSMKGFDLYIKDETGRERYYNSFRPPIAFEEGYESVVDLPEGMKDITLYFPMYNQVDDVYVGLQEKAVLKEGSPYKYAKPVLVYGSSITQGCCTSRSGNVYSSILGRILDVNTWNFGASGSAKGQMPTAEFIGEQDLAAFVYDYDHNAPNAAYLQETHEKFFRVIRDKNPQVPVIFLSKPDSGDPERAERKEIIRQTYMNAKAAGDENVYFIDGETLIVGEEGDVGMADSTHPNDFGQLLMAKGIAPILKEILENS